MNSRLALRNIEKDWKVPPIAYRLAAAVNQFDERFTRATS